MYSKERNQAKINARVSRGKYRCNMCKQLFSSKQVQVDHIKEVGKFVDWNSFIRRLFCSISNLQVLCVKCHLEKK
jgi:hypothetical protein